MQGSILHAWRHLQNGAERSMTSHAAGAHAQIDGTSGQPGSSALSKAGSPRFVSAGGSDVSFRLV